MDKRLISDYAWILRGSQRRKIINVLDRAKTPTQIKEEIKVKVSNISDILRDMCKRRMAHCLNPEEKLGRLYELTKKGHAIRKELSKPTKN